MKKAIGIILFASLIVFTFSPVAMAGFYSSQKYKFSMEWPEYMKRDKNGETGVIKLHIKADKSRPDVGTHIFFVVVQPMGNGKDTRKKLLSDTIKGFKGQKVLQRSETEVDGIPASRALVTSKEGYPTEIIVLFANNNFYCLAGVNYKDNQEKLVSDFKQLISNFRARYIKSPQPKDDNFGNDF